MLGGETPPNICRQKHGHTKKESSIKKQNMKSTYGNLEIYTTYTYTTHAICVLAENDVEDEEAEEWEGWEDEAEEWEGEGDGEKVVIKTDPNVFRQFHSPTFFMTQRTFVHFFFL
jgi:hypothetical protein